ncbi:MAG: hypothetical protein CL678_04955 [Bdellovibrionaceae bacterium]|nr:hypothetical protein [Pseudobdellovibrionaceae bacterium]|tara:strand:- start:1032 stop:1505 length:474 start_codon:yes stop_codon:yes gene_type:complete
MKRIIAFALLVLSLNTFAESLGIECRDTEDSVGFNKMTLKKDLKTGKYELMVEVIVTGDRPRNPYIGRRITFIENLDCNIKGLIAFCTRKKNDYEKRAPILNVSIIEKHSYLYSLDQELPSSSSPSLRFESNTENNVQSLLPWSFNLNRCKEIEVQS